MTFVFFFFFFFSFLLVLVIRLWLIRLPAGCSPWSSGFPLRGLVLCLNHRIYIYKITPPTFGEQKIKNKKEFHPSKE